MRNIDTNMLYESGNKYLEKIIPQIESEIKEKDSEYDEELFEAFKEINNKSDINFLFSNVVPLLNEKLKTLDNAEDINAIKTHLDNVTKFKSELEKYKKYANAFSGIKDKLDDIKDVLESNNKEIKKVEKKLSNTTDYRECAKLKLKLKTLYQSKATYEDEYLKTKFRMTEQLNIDSKNLDAKDIELYLHGLVDNIKSSNLYLFEREIVGTTVKVNGTSINNGSVTINSEDKEIDAKYYNNIKDQITECFSEAKKISDEIMYMSTQEYFENRLSSASMKPSKPRNNSNKTKQTVKSSKKTVSKNKANESDELENDDEKLKDSNDVENNPVEEVKEEQTNSLDNSNEQVDTEPTKDVSLKNDENNNKEHNFKTSKGYYVPTFKGHHMIVEEGKNNIYEPLGNEYANVEMQEYYKSFAPKNVEVKEDNKQNNDNTKTNNQTSSSIDNTQAKEESKNIFKVVKKRAMDAKEFTTEKFKAVKNVMKNIKTKAAGVKDAAANFKNEVANVFTEEHQPQR